MKLILLVLTVYEIINAAPAAAKPRVRDLFNPNGNFLQGNIHDESAESFELDQHASDYFPQFASLMENKKFTKKCFRDFKRKNHKSYKNRVEDEFRLDHFKLDLLDIYEHNAKAVKGEKLYFLGVNEFSDMSPDEVINTMTGYWPSKEDQNETRIRIKRQSSDSSTPYSWWVDPYRAAKVTPVRNQGSCGSCVSHAVTAALESSWAIRGHPLVKLSVQQLNDCGKNPAKGNNGCRGHTFVPSFEYILKHGLTTEHNYPYFSKDDPCNKFKESQVMARISSWHRVTPYGDEKALKRAFDKHGPIAVAIHVNDKFQKYKEGIFDEYCKGGRNHAVLLVGYGYDRHYDKDYWIIKNQWGTSWGESGYMRMRRNNNNMCDIAGDAVWVE